MLPERATSVRDRSREGRVQTYPRMITTIGLWGGLHAIPDTCARAWDPGGTECAGAPGPAVHGHCMSGPDRRVASPCVHTPGGRRLPRSGLASWSKPRSAGAGRGGIPTEAVERSKWATLVRLTFVPALDWVMPGQVLQYKLSSGCHGGSISGAALLVDLGEKVSKAT